jgi:hypothetical protein
MLDTALPSFAVKLPNPAVLDQGGAAARRRISRRACGPDGPVPARRGSSPVPGWSASFARLRPGLFRWWDLGPVVDHDDPPTEDTRAERLLIAGPLAGGVQLTRSGDAKLPLAVDVPGRVFDRVFDIHQPSVVPGGR